MSIKRPVVVYGVSGFSGRLVAQFLREYNVTFVAAGRSRDRLEDVIHHVLGIETADYEIAKIGCSMDELTELFRRGSPSSLTKKSGCLSNPRIVEPRLPSPTNFSLS